MCLFQVSHTHSGDWCPQGPLLLILIYLVLGHELPVFFQNSYVAALKPSNSVSHLIYGGPICKMGTITPTAQGHGELTDEREPYFTISNYVFAF